LPAQPDGTTATTDLVLMSITDSPPKLLQYSRVPSGCTTNCCAPGKPTPGPMASTTVLVAVAITETVGLLLFPT